MQDLAFDKIKSSLLSLDPVAWCEENLTLEGKPFRLEESGYKPFIEIFRYLGIKALEKSSKPLVLLKSRQTGGSITATAMQMFYMGSGLFGTGANPPIRVVHCWPTLDRAAAHSKTKLSAMIDSSRIVDIPGKKAPKPLMRTLIDNSSAANDNIQFKQFKGGNHIWIESAGLDGSRLRGKQLCLETELPAPNGFLKLKDIQEGQELFDENGEICRVTKIHPVNETPEAYRITFDDGTTVDACSEHLWLTYTKNDRKRKTRHGNPKIPNPKVKTTKEIFQTLKVTSKLESNHSIPCAKPLKYSEMNLPIDPYLLGVWLGDGIKATGSIESADEEILNEIRKTGYSVNLMEGASNNSSKSNTYRIGEIVTYEGSRGHIGELTWKLKDLGVLNNKHIPEIYLKASYEQRLALCQGLMDTDGSCDKGNRIEYCSVIPQLAENVLELLLSLGIKGHKIENDSYLYDKKCANRFRLNFVTKLPVFRLSYKLARIKKSDNAIYMSTHRYITNVERIESKPMRCITVDSPSHLFLITRNLIPTHNTADVVLFDEIQEIPATAISNSTKVLTKAQYGANSNGVQMYFGTPLQKGSAFWKMWQQSSQQYYHLGCKECKEVFPLYTPESDSWESVWIYENIVKCSLCGYEQDRMEAINRGKWVASKNADDCPFIGFHINQLYMPEITKEEMIAAKPENSAVNTERAYQNEVLGEFFNGSSGIITTDEIRIACGDPERKFRSGGYTEEENNIISFIGIDIGGKADMEQLAEPDKFKGQGQSYSVAVVLQLTGPGKLSIDYAFKFQKNDNATKKNLIDEAIKRFKPKLTVCDFGYAHELNENMQSAYGDKFLASVATGQVKEHIKYDSDIFPKQIKFERDYWIMELYEKMKSGHIRFPMGSYEQVQWLIQHCANMEIKPVTKNGNISPHYVKAGVNDGFMALLNAYIAYKFYITQGFTVHSAFANINNKPKKEQSSVSLGYSKRQY